MLKITMIGNKRFRIGSFEFRSWPWSRTADHDQIVNGIKADIKAYKRGIKIVSIAKDRQITTMTLQKMLRACSVKLRTKGGYQISRFKPIK